ncbi:MAG: Membrane protein, partial [Acidimicrobiales bacterium]|nr:Membrane protein [Acidimicrobiales bacterium]
GLRRAAARAAGRTTGPARHERTAPPPTPEAVRAPSTPRHARGSSTLDRLTMVLANRAWARRLVGASAALLAVGSVGFLAYPLLSDGYQHHLQTKLARRFVSPETKRAFVHHQVKVGDSLTRLRIPKIGLDTIVVEGTTLSALRAGAGHYPETPLPCANGNVAVAGHRTTYGHPFQRLAELSVGDEITLETPIGSCRYRITTAPFPVSPTDYQVVAPTPGAELTLTTCHPEHSARQRLVLHATLISRTTEPVT